LTVFTTALPACSTTNVTAPPCTTGNSIWLIW
jgi:hypothetical protein